MGKALVITTGGGTDVEEGNPNAKAEHVLSGYTFYAKESDRITGSMPNQGSASTNSLSPGNSVTVAKGWYAGNRKYTVVSLSSQTSATAGAAQVLKDYTGWKDGSKITGTMINRGAISQSLSANGTYTVPAGWHNGSGKVTQSLTTQAAKTITPGTSQQTIINSNVWTTGAQTVSGNANLVAGNIKKGVTIFGVSGTFQGIVDNPAVLVNQASLNFGVTQAWKLSSNKRANGGGGLYSFTHSNVNYQGWRVWSGYDTVYLEINKIPKFSKITNITGTVYYSASASDSEGLNGFSNADTLYVIADSQVFYYLGANGITKYPTDRLTFRIFSSSGGVNATGSWSWSTMYGFNCKNVDSSNFTILNEVLNKVNTLKFEFNVGCNGGTSRHREFVLTDLRVWQ